MKNIIIIVLVSLISFSGFSQKRSKKKSKDVETSVKSSFEFMIIKGAEIEMIDESIDEAEKREMASDVSFERKLKRMIAPQTKLVVSFDAGDMRNPEIGELMRKSNQFRTMGAAVKAASAYGWEFINANVIPNENGVIHYYYMKR